MDILNEIAEYAAYRVFMAKREYSLEELKERCEKLDAGETTGGSYSASAYAQSAHAQAASDTHDNEDRPGISILSGIFGRFRRQGGRTSETSDTAKTTLRKADAIDAAEAGTVLVSAGSYAAEVGTVLASAGSYADAVSTASASAGSGADNNRIADSSAATAGSASYIAGDDGLFRFGRALKKPGISVISEIKKASPSKGIISPDFPYLDIAGAYERAGADCISCLTEPKWFLGSDDIFTAVRAYTKLPMIRKDFVVDEYQLYEAKLLGADAVLLICALLDTDAIHYYLDICRKLKLDALVETHDEAEISSAVSAGARIIGVNNRNLRDFSVNFDNAARLRELIPSDCIYVAESGVKSAEDAHIIKNIGADAMLIGEALMRAEDKAALIRAFKEA